MNLFARPACIGALVCAVAGSALAQSAPAKTEAATKPALTVSTVKPATLSLPGRLVANGNIAAWQEAGIGAEVNGLRLSEVLVNVGDAVRRGQLLARFDDATVQADVAQAQAALQEAEANVAEAAANAARARTVQGTGSVSAQQIEQYLSAERTTQARLASARASLQAQQLRERHTRVSAPDDGVISARSASVGAVLGAGTELFRLIRQNRLEWRAEVTAAELPRIKPGQPVLLSPPGATQPVRGKVRVIAPTVDPQSRSALVYVDLPAGTAARAGMYASGEFEFGSTSALTVPQQAVVLRDGFAYVFRLRPDSRVAQQKVQTGRRVGDRVEITAGLTPDAVLVGSGAGFLNDGDLVRVADAAARPAPGNASSAVAR